LGVFVESSKKIYQIDGWSSRRVKDGFARTAFLLDEILKKISSE
jgi:hypothetical protein